MIHESCRGGTAWQGVYWNAQFRHRAVSPGDAVFLTVVWAGQAGVMIVRLGYGDSRLSRPYRNVINDEKDRFL